MQLPAWMNSLPARMHLWKKQTEATPDPAAAFGHHAGDKKKVPERQKKIMDINPRWIAAAATFLFFVWTIVYYCYLTFYEIGRLEAIQAEKEQILVNKKREILDLQKDGGYLRFNATQRLMELDKTIDWRESIIYLVWLYDIMRTMGANESTLSFKDFQVSADRIIVRWTVPSMAEIYKDKGLLDRLNKFDFIEHITIPYYDQEGGEFHFVLDAKIKQYDRIKPTS